MKILTEELLFKFKSKTGEWNESKLDVLGLKKGETQDKNWYFAYVGKSYFDSVIKVLEKRVHFKTHKPKSTREQKKESLKTIQKASKLIANDQIIAQYEDSTRNFSENEEFAHIEAIKFFGVTGIYFLFEGNQIVYIGESQCVISRISQHWEDKTKQFSRFTFSVFEGTTDARKRKERALIRRFKPKYNNIHNPNINRRRTVKILYGRSRT